MPHHGYQRSENRFPGHALPCDQYQSHLQPHYMQYVDTVDDRMSAHSSNSAHNQKHSAESTGDYNVTRPTALLPESNGESDRFTAASHQGMRSEQAVSSVGRLSSISGQCHVSDCDSCFDRLQVRHNASTSINNSG